MYKARIFSVSGHFCLSFLITLKLSGHVLASDIIEIETQHFTIVSEAELDPVADLLAKNILDQCAERTDLLEYRTGSERIPFLIARDIVVLDEIFQNYYKGQISVSPNTSVRNEFCGGGKAGGMLVTAGTIRFCVGDQAFWLDRIRDEKKFCPDITHEMMHIVQNELTGGGLRNPGQSATDVLGPAWMFEGAAELSEHISRFGEARLDLIDMLVRDSIPPGSLELSQMESFDMRGTYKNLHYTKGFIAAKFLYDRSGSDSILSFYKCIGRKKDWEHCFEKTFEMSVERFYSIRSLK
ncbi:hypothetical protein GN278_09265 [Rhodobacteraceae bacterium Araon29]